MDKIVSKIRFCFFVVLVVFSILCPVSTAIGEIDIKSVELSLFDYLVDDYIQNCQSKSNLIGSKSHNIRKDAALAALKVEYLNTNKYQLIDQMLEAELSMKKYKVRYFLNARFFSYYTSKSNPQQKVIEANLSKSKFKWFLESR